MNRPTAATLPGSFAASVATKERSATQERSDYRGLAARVAARMQGAATAPAPLLALPPPVSGWRIAQPGEALSLMPGELWSGRGAASVRTLLGSCVALTLWHPRLRVGGMCHYLLPRRQRKAGVVLSPRNAGSGWLKWLLEDRATVPVRLLTRTRVARIGEVSS